MTTTHDIQECSETYLERAFDHLDLDEARRLLLRTPYRELELELPLEREARGSS